jgi:hypothetical protein
MSSQKRWVCSQGCEIETVLVCGGDLGDPDSPNIYFHMNLDGTYTQQFADGTIGVEVDCHVHADEGCSMEPQCPECFLLCRQEDVTL